MTAPWLLPLHLGLAGRDWLIQAAVILLIAGLWLLLAGIIERRSGQQEKHQRAPR